jgi:REP element-mobilizing transposase RayT
VPRTSTLKGLHKITKGDALMPQSLAQVYLHIVFSTKNRIPYLKEKELRDRLHAYLAGICKNLDSPALIVGGFQDHVHLLCRHSKNMALSHFLQELKRDSSKWAKPISIRSNNTSPTKKGITSVKRSKMNSGDCVGNTVSRLMNGMSGIKYGKGLPNGQYFSDS